MNWILQGLTRMVDQLQEVIEKKPHDIVGVAVGGTTGFISSAFFHDWMKPVLLSAACAFVGLVISHYGKKVFVWIDRKITAMVK